MFEILNHQLFLLLAAPQNSTPLSISGAIIVADWAIYAGPATLVLLWLIGATPQRRAAVGACLSAFLALAVATTLAAHIFHPRPFMDGLAANILAHAPDSSFPSDHATLLFALAFSLLISPPARTRGPGLLLLAVALAVGWSRIYLGVHYPFDIAGGAALGLAAAIILATWPGIKLRDAVTTFGEWLYARLLTLARRNNRNSHKL